MLFFSFSIFVITDYSSMDNWDTWDRNTQIHKHIFSHKSWKKSLGQFFHIGVYGLLELHKCILQGSMKGFKFCVFFFLAKISWKGIKCNYVLDHLVTIFYPSFDPGFFLLLFTFVLLFSTVFTLREGQMKSRNNIEQSFSLVQIEKKWSENGDIIWARKHTESKQNKKKNLAQLQ